MDSDNSDRYLVSLDSNWTTMKVRSTSYDQGDTLPSGLSKTHFSIAYSN